MKGVQELDRLFNPSSLAVIGASGDVRKTGGRFLKGLIDNGFRGTLYPVNPNESEIMGLRSYPSVLDIPGEVDLTIVVVPARTVPQVIAECSQKGVGFAVVHTIGFSELGSTEGRKLEEEMLKFARQGGTRIIGPNCMGIYSPKAGINTIVSRFTFKKEAGSVAFAGQSGWVTENAILIGHERGLSFSKVISIGNQSDLSMEDLLEYFASDAETKVIAFYIEGIKRGREFLQLAKQISKRKPIIVWKVGRTEAGVRAAASHTGSLAGNSVVFDAALMQGGIAIAENLEELFDLMVGFTCPVLPGGNKVGVVTEAGGGAAAGADVAEALGLEIPSLSAETEKKLADVLQSVQPVPSRGQNPLDIVGAPIDKRAGANLQCARIMLADDIDAIVIITYVSLNDYYVNELVSLRDKMGKPIFIIPGHFTMERTGAGLLARNGIPTFTIPERAFKTLSAMVRYSNLRHQS